MIALNQGSDNRHDPQSPHIRPTTWSFDHEHKYPCELCGSEVVARVRIVAADKHSITVCLGCLGRSRARGGS